MKNILTSLLLIISFPALAQTGVKQTCCGSGPTNIAWIQRFLQVDSTSLLDTVKAKYILINGVPAATPTSVAAMIHDTALNYVPLSDSANSGPGYLTPSGADGKIAANNATYPVHSGGETLQSVMNRGDTTNKQLVINTDSLGVESDSSAAIFIKSHNNNAGMQILLRTASDSATNNYLSIGGQLSGGTILLPTITKSGTELFAWQAGGYTGSRWRRSSAYIIANAASDWSGSSNSVDLSFGVTNIGSTSSYISMQLLHDRSAQFFGDVNIQNGNLLIGSVPTYSTGTITPLVFNSTSGRVEKTFSIVPNLQSVCAVGASYGGGIMATSLIGGSITAPYGTSYAVQVLNSGSSDAQVLFGNGNNATIWTYHNSGSGTDYVNMANGGGQTILGLLGNNKIVAVNSVADNGSGAKFQVTGASSFNDGTQVVGYYLRCTNATTGASDWEAVSGGSGTVTSITPGYGLTPNTTITTSGTINVDTVTGGTKIATQGFVNRAVAASAISGLTTTQLIVATSATTIGNSAISVDGSQNVSGVNAITAGGSLQGAGITSTVHFECGESITSIVAGVGAGSGAIISCIGCTDHYGTISVTTGSSPATNSVIATITFGSAFGSAPTIGISPGNGNAGTLFATTVPYWSSTTSAFTVSATNSALGATTYLIGYRVN